MTQVTEYRALELLHEYFSRGEPFRLVVTGTSMVPFLRSGKDSVLLSPLSKPPKRGQIFLFRMGDRLVLHRLWKITEKGWIMNGDGQVKLERIQAEQVEAVVTHVIRQSGRVYSCDRWTFRLMSALWRPSRPIRPRLLPVMGRLRGLWPKK